MRITSLLILGLLIFGSLTSSIPADTGINFYYNLEKALQMSKETGKPIFLDAYASWCGPCKKLDNTTFNNPKVGEFYNEKFINVKIDFDKNPQLRQKYAVNAYPTLMYLNSDGSVKHKRIGYVNASQLLTIGQKVIE